MDLILKTFVWTFIKDLNLMLCSAFQFDSKFYVQITLQFHSIPL